jgi:formylglycine-generating enzyme required for sulfatase activity
MGLIWLPLSLFANNLNIDNVELTGQNTSADYTMVQFDISWDNSWRNAVNWDAAWIFVKYRVSAGEWRHAYLDTDDSYHTAPTGSVINTGITGSYAPGVFIYRDVNGSGSNNWNNVQLRWNYGDNGLDDNDLVTVKVFAIEMVYVPQGAFDLGDATGGSTTDHFYDAGNGNGQPFRVTTQGAITTSASGAGNLWASGSIDAGTSDTNFPTGYNDFYCMKYEITQEQYVDFLNTLTRTQQNTRTETDISGTSITNRYVMSNYSMVMYRNGIRCDATLPASGPITVYCDIYGDGIYNEDNDGQNIACNFLTWMDGCAYADWAGLRPMTELEYEKTCRGDQAAVAGEYAWGNSNIYASGYTLSNRNYYNEVINGQPSSTGNASYETTTHQIGPLRVGIFALTSTTREEAGASYYGIMELSGNLSECTVIIGNSDGRAFSGNHGDGELSTNGNATETSWPGLISGEVTGSSGAGRRGGFWDGNASGLHVSDRISAGYIVGGRVFTGFRCVRSAP